MCLVTGEPQRKFLGDVEARGEATTIFVAYVLLPILKHSCGWGQAVAKCTIALFALDSLPFFSPLLGQVSLVLCERALLFVKHQD